MSQISNALLASLSAGDAAALRSHLKPAYLEQRTVLFEVGGRIDAAYFPMGSVISLVVGLSTGETVEAAMVGRDGVVGAASSLDGRISPSRAIVQLAGAAMKCDADALKSAAMQSKTLLSVLIRHEQTLYFQAQQSTACMSSHHIEARLCRWLLRARDLSGNDTLNFTQEVLAEMLGVRRGSVTVAARALQSAGMIKYARGKIQIINIEGLQGAACECYETVKANHRALLGGTPKLERDDDSKKGRPAS